MTHIKKNLSGEFLERFHLAGDTDIEISADTDAVGTIIIKNHGKLNVNVAANHVRDNVKIHIMVKLLAGENSENGLAATATIAPGVQGADSDIGFSVIARPGAKIKMQPDQRISSVPVAAGHSASIYRPSPAQIIYLESAGLTDADKLLEQAFLMDEVV